MQLIANKHVSQNKMEIDKSIVTKIVSKGETKNAIDYILKVIDEKSKHYSSIVNLSSRYNRLAKDKLNGFIDDDYFNKEINKINHALVDFGKEQLDSPIIKKKKNVIKYIIGFFLLAIVSTGLWYAYSNSKTNIERDKETSVQEASDAVEVVKTEVHIPIEAPKPKAIVIPMPLSTEYTLDSFTGANYTIANKTDHIVLIRNLKVLWNYQKCTTVEPIIMPQVKIVYNYNIDITKRKSEKIIDKRDFTYSKGEIESFKINITYPDTGVYTIWIGFEYKTFGNSGWNDYISEERILKRCFK